MATTATGQPGPTGAAARSPSLASPRRAGARAWLGAVALVAAAAGLAWTANRALAVPDVEMLFLLAVAMAAAWLGRGPALLAAGLGVAAYDFLFVPPAFTLDVHDAAYLLTFLMMFAIGIVISGLTERLRQAVVQAATEEQRSVLLSAVSHDLRTPLAVITGAASALRDDPGLAAAQRRDLLDTICEEAEHLERQVGNLLDMTRLQGEQVVLRREWVPLEEIAVSALGRLERQLGDRPVRVDLGGAPLASVDPVLLERLLANLLENAAKYTPPGSPLELSARGVPGAVELELADRGPGVPPGDEERIFERFRRGHHPGTGGVGLGLAIARAIARAHGATLTVANRPGGGAVFRLVIPVPGEPPPVPDASPPRGRA